MAGYCTLAQCGSVRVSHFRYALSRHSRSHSGSSFFAEIARTTSSLKPGGKTSASIGVTKPYAYSRLTRVSTDASIYRLPPAIQGDGRASSLGVRIVGFLVGIVNSPWLSREGEVQE